MAGLGFACLLLALVVCAYGIGASLYGVRSGRVEFSESGRRSVYALAVILTVAFVVLEVAFLRNDFAFNTVADTSSRTTPALLPRGRGVVLAGRLAAVVGVAAVAVVEPRAVPDTQAHARRRRLRDRDPARLRRLLRGADGLLREPVRHHASGAAGRRRPRSAAALPDDDDPPADAVLGLHALHDPARVRHRCAARAPGRRRLDQSDPPLRVRRLAVPRHRASCWARAGPTPSSAGAATGAGMPSRTRR